MVPVIRFNIVLPTMSYMTFSSERDTLHCCWVLWRGERAKMVLVVAGAVKDEYDLRLSVHTGHGG
jgi:hypothetical protein